MLKGYRELDRPTEPLEPRATRWRREYPEMFEACDRAIEAGVADEPRFELTAETSAEMYFRVWVKSTQPFVAQLNGNRMRWQSETGEWIDQSYYFCTFDRNTGQVLRAIR